MPKYLEIKKPREQRRNQKGNQCFQLSEDENTTEFGVANADFKEKIAQNAYIRQKKGLKPWPHVLP